MTTTKGGPQPAPKVSAVLHSRVDLKDLAEAVSALEYILGQVPQSRSRAGADIIACFAEIAVANNWAIKMASYDEASAYLRRKGLAFVQTVNAGSRKRLAEMIAREDGALTVPFATEATGLEALAAARKEAADKEGESDET